MYHIIVNPSSKSGMGKKKWQELKSLLLKEKVTYNAQFTKGPMSAYKCIRQITNQESVTENKVIVLGGDGTMNEVLNGIMDFEHTYITYLPTGSSNDLARDMKIPADATVLMQKLKKLNSDITPSDYGEVKFSGGKRKFLVSSGIGFDAAVCEQSLSSSTKNFLNSIKLGKLTYAATAFKLLAGRKPIEADIYCDGSEKPIHIHNMLFLAVMNHRYEGGGFMFTPEANAQDGYLDICIAHGLRLPQILILLPLALKGKHIGHKGITIMKCKTIEIHTDSKQPVHTDGEICGHFDHLTYRCDKQGVKLI